MAFSSPGAWGNGVGLTGLNVDRSHLATGAGQRLRWRPAVGRHATADRPYVGTSDGVEDLPMPEGDTGLPFFGNSFEISACPLEFFQQRMKRYGPISIESNLGSKMISVSGVNEVQQMMRQEKELLEHNPYFSVAELLGRRSIFITKGAEHARLRQLLNPVFTPAAVDNYIPGIVKRAEAKCEEWANKSSFSLVDQVKRYTFAVISVGVAQFKFTGKSMDEVVDLFNEYWEGVFSFGINLPFTRFGKSMKARKGLLKIIDDEISSLGSPPYQSEESMLKKLLEAEDDHGRKLSRAQIKDIIITLFMAGYDTTACVITTVMMELAKNEKIWEKIRDEQRNVVSLFGSEITPEATKSMPYLDAVVQEGLRMVPALPIRRKAAKTFEVNGFKIPKGWTIAVETGATTRLLDPRWHNHDDFCPERYLTDSSKKQEAFAPFGLGIRTCLGKEIAKAEAKILFAVLARSYKVFIDNPTPEMMYRGMPEPIDGLPGRIERIC